MTISDIVRHDFVRHGVTTAWEENRYQSPDSPLSERGIREAFRVAAYLSTNGIQYNYVVTSTMPRARQTAEPIALALGVPLIEEKRFEEIGRPTCVHGKLRTDPNVRKIMEELYRNVRNERSVRIYDEEPFVDFRDRVYGGWSDQKRLPGNAVIVCHGHVKRVINGMVLNRGHVSGEMFDHFAQAVELENGAISTFECRYGLWRLRTWNDTSHLTALR